MNNMQNQRCVVQLNCHFCMDIGHKPVVMIFTGFHFVDNIHLKLHYKVRSQPQCFMCFLSCVLLLH